MIDSRRSSKVRLNSGIRTQASNDFQNDDLPCCRICLIEEEADNPIVTPCKCSGSLGYLHIKCIREWLAKKKQTFPDRRGVVFRWENIQCEICQTIYDTFVNTISKEDDKQCILDFQVDSKIKNYIALEFLNSKLDTKTI